MAESKQIVEPQDWYFTFPSDERGLGRRYEKIHGTFGDAREEMFRRHGKRWAFQYSWADFEYQIEPYRLEEIK